MAVNHSTLNQATIEQVGWIACEIATLALTAKRISSDAIELAGNDQSLAALLDSNEIIAEKIGFLADLCSEKIGASQTNGGAEAWMLPPVYHDVVNTESEHAKN